MGKTRNLVYIVAVVMVWGALLCVLSGQFQATGGTGSPPTVSPSPDTRKERLTVVNNSTEVICAIYDTADDTNILKEVLVPGRSVEIYLPPKTYELLAVNCFGLSLAGTRLDLSEGRTWRILPAPKP